MSSRRKTLPPANGRPSIPQEGKRPQLKIKVMSWNINGSGERGFAEKRKWLVPAVIGEMDSEVLLLQETTTNVLVKNIISKAGRTYNEVRAGDKKEARVLYDSNLYEAISPYDRVFPRKRGRGNISLAEALEQSIPEEEQRELWAGAAGWMRELFRRRIAIVGLKRKDHELVSKRVTIFMSFHNLYNSRRSKMRKRAANRFCQIVQSMRELTGTVVIAGADLNQQMRSDSPRIPQYKPTWRRRSRVIDYFILDSPPGGMEHSEVTALDIIGNLSNLLHIPMSLLKGPRHAIPDYRRAINHDPLIISVTL